MTGVAKHNGEQEGECNDCVKRWKRKINYYIPLKFESIIETMKAMVKLTHIQRVQKTRMYLQNQKF